MKIKTISRGVDTFRERSGDLYNVKKNPDPNLHPLEQAREYARAVIALKKERIFAKPFLGSLSGHTDGVYALKSWDGSTNKILSGSGNGEIKVWDLSKQTLLFSEKGHTKFVRGLATFPENIDQHEKKFISAGEDQLIKFWNLDSKEPTVTISHVSPITSLSKNFTKPIYVTTGDTVNVWNYDRVKPVQEYRWGVDTSVTSNFNKSEQNLFITSSMGRTITIYDIRMNTPIARNKMTSLSNDIEWNPMEPFNFTTVNDDFKCYTFDMRRLDVARYVYKGSVSSVISLSYSPTGQSFVTGSYDAVIRLYDINNANPVDLYHTKRMQRVFSVAHSSDGRFIISGSDEGNIRLWKSNASEKLGVLSNREISSIQYSRSLINKFKNMEGIRRITNSRHIPKRITKERQKLTIMNESKKRKLQNAVLHSKLPVNPYVSERSKSILPSNE